MRHWRLLSVLLVPLLAAGCGGEATPTPPGTGGNHTGGGDGHPGTHRVGGTVSGLLGSGLALRLNDGPALAVTAAGPFTFPDALPTGTAYAVSVATQPTAPEQLCTVANGVGTVGTLDVTHVQVTCVSVSDFSVGGSVANLEGSGLKLSRNGVEELEVPADATSFTFPTRLDDGAAYAVTVLQQPPGATCTVANGTGTVASASVSSVSVTCIPNAVVLLAGDGQPAPADGTAVAVSLQEYAPEARPALRSLIAPVSLGAGTTYEGALSRSADGRLVSFAAYSAAPGTPAVASSTVAAPRAAVTVDAAGVATVAVLIPETTAFSNRQVRSAVTEDGTAFWLSGDGAVPPIPPATSPTSNGGVWYAKAGAPPVRISGVPNAARWLGIFGGGLYLSAAPRPAPPPGSPPGTEPLPSAYVGVSRVGAEGVLPTEATTCTRIAGTNNGTPSVEIATNAHGFAFVSAGAAPGLDVLYVANDSVSTAGSVHVQKYVWNAASGQWEHVAGFVPTFAEPALPGVAALGLAAKRLADGSTLVYATTSAHQLVTFRDDGSSTPAVTVLATAPANSELRSVALAPVKK